LTLMNEKPKQKEPIAEQINVEQQRLEDMFKKHFWGATRLTLLGVFLFIIADGVVVFAFREPTNTALIKQLEISNTTLWQLTQAAINARSANTPALAELLKVTATQAEVHQRAVLELQTKEKEIPKEAASFLQILGGSVILALIGFLGIQRLQSIDTEMQGLREFMFKQIGERVAEQKALLESLVRGEVAKAFGETKAELEEIRKESEKLGLDAQTSFAKQVEEATSRIADVQAKVSELIAKYSWLQDTELKSAADDLSRIVSVEQAHNRAVQFRSSNDVNMARLALRQILERRLTGDADEFHNAHTEAFRLDDPELALKLSELGLESFSDQFDLMADKARALVSTGRRDDARALLEDWMDRKPSEFSRSWRPFTFYTDIVGSCELTEASLKRLEGAFVSVTTHLPYIDHPWGRYAQFLTIIGNIAKAEKIARGGLEKNPFSQHLSFVLADILMKQGCAKESAECLERALRSDYQDQFQHSVSQDAVTCLLAQAYEASGQTGKAEELYQVTMQIGKREQVKEYSKNRIIAIRVAKELAPSNEEQGSANSTPKEFKTTPL